MIIPTGVPQNQNHLLVPSKEQVDKMDSMYRFINGWPLLSLGLVILGGVFIAFDQFVLSLPIEVQFALLGILVFPVFGVQMVRIGLRLLFKI